MRTTPTIRAALEKAAEEGGRSLAQEIEQRLERSVLEDQHRGSHATSTFVAAIIQRINEIEADNEKDWLKDAFTYGAVRYAIEEELENRLPVQALVAREIAKELDEVESYQRLIRYYQSGRMHPSLVLSLEEEVGDDPVQFVENKLAAAIRRKEEILAPTVAEMNRGRAHFQVVLDRELDERVARGRR